MARQITPGKGLQILFQDSSFLGNANRLLAFLHKLCHQVQDLQKIISTNSNNLLATCSAVTCLLFLLASTPPLSKSFRSAWLKNLLKRTPVIDDSCQTSSSRISDFSSLLLYFYSDLDYNLLFFTSYLVNTSSLFFAIFY